MNKIFLKFIIISYCFLTFFNTGKSSTKEDPIQINNLENLNEKSDFKKKKKKNLPQYFLGPGDILSIKIYKFKTFS